MPRNIYANRWELPDGEIIHSETKPHAQAQAFVPKFRATKDGYKPYTSDGSEEWRYHANLRLQAMVNAHPRPSRSGIAITPHKGRPHKLNAWLSDDAMARLEALALATGNTKADIVNLAIMAYGQVGETE